MKQLSNPSGTTQRSHIIRRCMRSQAGGERMVGEYFGVVHAISNSQPKDGQHDRIGALTGVIHGRRGRSAEPMERRNGQVKVDIG